LEYQAVSYPQEISLRRRTTLSVNFYSLFWWGQALLSLAGIPLIINYLTDGAIDFIYLFKVPLIGLFFILVFFHFKHPLKVSFITILFGIYGSISIIVGLIEGTLFTKPALTHLYIIAMSTFGCSFGYWMAMKDEAAMQRLIHRVMSFIFWVSVFTLLAYFYFHYVTGSIVYFGFDSYLPLVSALFLADRDYACFACATLLVILSGKRAPLISMIIPFVILQLKNLLSLRKKTSITSFAVILLMVSALAYLSLMTDVLHRWKLIASIDAKNTDSIYVATSGRSVEIMGLWNHLSEKPIRWFIGSGIGGEYTIDATFRDEIIHNSKHYLHLAVATYLLLFGAPFLLLFLSFIAYVFWRNRRDFDNFYYIGMLVTFIGSLFGAGMIVDPIFWVFLGANIHSLKKGS